MGLFDKLFKSEKPNQETQIDTSKFQKIEKSDFENFQDLLEQNAGLSFEKQLAFADVIGNNSWELDMDQEKIFFGKLAFPIQIIGSLSFGNNSWMWGWANTQSGLPENLLVQSNKIKEIGEQKNIEELTEGHYNVEEGFEHKMGMIACGLFRSKSYYCANYGQGTLVVTLDDPKIPNIDNNKLEKVLFTFPQLISSIELNNKNAFINYLIDRDCSLNMADNRIEGLHNNKLVWAEFDALDRLKSLNGKV